MNRRDYVFVIVILAIGWAFWLHRMGINDHDDAVSNELLFARAPLTQIVTRNPWPDQSPLYFIVLHGVRRAGESPFAIELFNALLLTLTLTSTYLVARAVSPSVSVARATLLLGAVSPASLWLVRSGRMYSIQVLLSVLTLLAVLAYLEDRRPRNLVAFTLLCVLNIYNHFAGFLISLVLLLPITADAWRALPQDAHGSERPSRPMLPVALAALAMVVLALPQVYRLVLLLSHAPPVTRGLSAPGLSGALVRQIGWFWFVNADWGILRRGGRTITDIYAASIAILALLGLAAIRRRPRVVLTTCIVIPVAALGMLAGTMDVRLRYFAWVLPLLWIAVAAGAFGPLPSGWTPDGWREAVAGFRRALAMAVIAGSTWLLWQKVPERYAEWTKLMMAVGQIYRPSMAVYMPPGPAIGTPRFLAQYLHLDPGLADVQPLAIGTRAAFERQVDDGEDFAFLVHWSYENDEFAWRTRSLQEHGYRRLSLSVWGARAEVFSRAAVDLARQEHIEPRASMDSVASWVETRLRGRTPGRGSPLQGALVAKVTPDGTVQEARLFSSQRGEDGSWWLGERDSDVVDDRDVTSAGAERRAVVTHPSADDLLVVAFPSVEVKRTVSLAYGLTDAAIRLGKGADVHMSVYLGGRNVGSLLCPNAAGWHELTLDTSAAHDSRADVVVLIAGSSKYGSEFAFQLSTSTRTVPAARLAGGRTLKDSIDQLTVYRLSGASRIDARHAVESRSPTEMHEAAGPAGQGAVERHWVVGPALWDAVGLTRQASGGQVRDGLWAHPRNGTTLVIELPAAQIGTRLHGYFGITDFAVAQAALAGVAAPVQFRVLVDGTAVIAEAAPRQPGWRSFSVALPRAGASGSIRVEIASANDRWAHFVFDLWTD